MPATQFLCNTCNIYIRLCAESVDGIHWWASKSWLLASGAAASAVCVATASMGGLDSAAAAASLVADAYMAAPADVAAAPAATAVGPMSWMDLISRDMNLYGLLYGLVCTTCGCRWTILEFICICTFLDNIKCLRCLFEIACDDNCDIYEMLVLFGVPYT